VSKHRRNGFAGIESLEDRKLLAASIKIVGNGQRIVPGDTTASRDDFTDYGPMALSGPITAAGRTYTIKNQGDSPLRMTGARISIQGADANQFSVSKSVKATIEAGGGATFRIKFDPTSAGVKRATIVVTSISQKSSYKFSIAARGVETTAVAGASTRIAKLSSGTGGAAANGMALKIKYSGFRADGLIFDPGTEPFTLNLGAHGVIVGWDKGFVGTKKGDKTVLFIPGSEAYPNGSGANIPPGTPLIFETETLGIGPSIYAQGANSTRIEDGDTTPSTGDGTNFGSIAKNSTVVKTFTLFADVSAEGATPSLTDTTTPIHVTGAAASDFTVSAITNGTFTVTFKPSKTGSRTATISIPNNNPFDNNYSWVITGTGI
jgi:hypothetical protein